VTGWYRASYLFVVNVGRMWTRPAVAARGLYGSVCLKRGVVLAAAVTAAGCVAPRLVRHHDTPAPETVTNEAYRGDPFLADVESRSFEYFWRTTDARTGLTPDRSPSPSFSSIAAIGFALTAYPIGVSEGYVTREQAAERTLTTLRTLYELPQGPSDTGVSGYKGFYYHFLNMDNARRFSRVELSTGDTALLLAGALFCQQYFDGPSATEAGIRAYADSLYARVDWQWASPNPPAVSLGWTPDSLFMPYDWRGYNEVMLLYVLALGSPTHPISPAAWAEYTRTYRWEEYFGQSFLSFAPAFGYQYSHVWIDFRGIQDPYMRSKGIDYFENSRRDAYAQRDYATLNPMGWKGYAPTAWGFSACDGPADTALDLDGVYRWFHTYWARGVSFTRTADDGTLSPAAIGGMIPFAPEIAVPALRSLESTYGNLIYSTYGFVDAFNPTFTTPLRMPLGRVDRTRGWFDTDYLGIDEGPVLAMIENYRTELIWTTMRRSPYIIRGLQRAGFTGGWLDHVAPSGPIASSAVTPAAPAAVPVKPADKQPPGTPPLAPAQPPSSSPPPTPAPTPAPAPAPGPQGATSPAATSPAAASPLSTSPSSSSPSGTSPSSTSPPAASSSPPPAPAQTPSSAPAPAAPPNR
jgi:hypothetical protein